MIPLALAPAPFSYTNSGIQGPPRFQPFLFLSPLQFAKRLAALSKGAIELNTQDTCHTQHLTLKEEKRLQTRPLVDVS